MTEMRERTEDWIMQAYIKDDPAYGCTHGIYRYDIDKRSVVCSRCNASIIDKQELDDWHEWVSCLCRRD